MQKPGHIDVSALDTPPAKHEFMTAKFLRNLGKDIIFIAPNRRRGAKTPDISMDGINWEIKCPKGSSSRTIENNFRSAIQQSKYIIFDLRRTTLPDDSCIKKLRREFTPRKSIKRLLVITKAKKLIDIQK